MGYAHDIGSQLAVVAGIVIAPTSTTGFTTASTASMGFPIDRQALAGDYQSVKSIVALFNRQISTSAAGYVTVGLRLEHADSSNSTSFTAAHTTATSIDVGCTSELAAANYSECHFQDIDLSGAKRWIRQVVTLARPATCSFDTVQADGVLVFGGGSVLPGT